MITPREITDSLEEVGDELGFDARASMVTGWTDARTMVQENQSGMVCEDKDSGNQHIFDFWVDPRTVDYS